MLRLGGLDYVGIRFVVPLAPRLCLTRSQANDGGGHIPLSNYSHRAIAPALRLTGESRLSAVTYKGHNLRGLKHTVCNQVTFSLTTLSYVALHVRHKP